MAVNTEYISRNLYSTPISSHAAMERALDMVDISYLIRQHLQGLHLKSAVLVCRNWWRHFAPYLWERVFIDTDLTHDEREVLVRNGLAARSLTLSIYDPLDTTNVVLYVAERCRNVARLHLKLFSPDLIIFDDEAYKARQRNIREMDDYENKKRHSHNSNSNYHSDYFYYFGIRSECKTELLDALFSKLPWVSELTLSIAHEDLRPEILWCVPTLKRLRKLTVLGGLPCNGYISHKNRQCDWNVLSRICQECGLLDSLVVSWEKHIPLENPSDRQLIWMSEMFASLETESPVISSLSSKTQRRSNFSVPQSERLQRLTTLCVSHCKLQALQMGLFYQSCSNLHTVEFKAVDAKPKDMEENLKSLVKSCPRLGIFRLVDTPQKNISNVVDYSTSLLTHPMTSLYSLTLSVPSKQSRTVFGNEPNVDPYLRQEYQTWTSTSNIPSLNIRDILQASVVLDVITTVRGLEQLTLDGYVDYRDSYWRPDLYDTPLDIKKLYNVEHDSLLRLPAFASQETLTYLDISTLDIEGAPELFKLVFWRIQELKRLRFLKISRKQVKAAGLGAKWQGRSRNLENAPVTAHSSEVELANNEGEDSNTDDNNNDGNNGSHHSSSDGNNYGSSNATTAQASSDSKEVFKWFPTVEHLYLVEMDKSIRYKWGEFLKPHEVSELVRMMPKLKAMTFNLDDAKSGLDNIIKTFPWVSFNFMMRK
ncbi:hypothetical protein FBU30_008560 [Linnemannia zychae]|nr:hypothetical protein FBU30_008560 [Linnemannia zychae]